MRDAFRLLDAWGFEDKTIITWVKESRAGKVNYGFGYYFRNDVLRLCETSRMGLYVANPFRALDT